MICYLKGTVKHGGVVDASGVGWEVKTPTALLDGEEVELFVQTDMRDSAITLYGFVNRDEKAAFLEIRKVPGVGPAAALALIGQLGLKTLAAAINTQDLKTLTAVKGVGPKVAKSVLLDVELDVDLEDDAVAGLIALGLSSQEARRCAKAARDSGASDTSATIRSALLIHSQ